MKKLALIAIGIIFLFLLGCSSATYTPPDHTNEASEYQIIVNHPYDTVWKKLIQYAAKTFFVIDNYEKESGLIIFTFSSVNPEQFVTGGHWTYQGPEGNFSGDYVKFLRSFHNAILKGRINIAVTDLGKNRTKIEVHVRYILAVPMSQNIRETIWAFDTGHCSTKTIGNRVSGTPATRTICPTYAIEKSILAALK